MNEPLHLPMLFHYIGIINIFISTFGVLINIRQAAFFLSSREGTAQKIGCSFLAGSMLYAMLCFLGIGINIELTIDQWMVFNTMLGIVMAFGIFASRRLYNHFRKM